jgi:hypothetical protein
VAKLLVISWLAWRLSAFAFSKLPFIIAIRLGPIGHLDVGEAIGWTAHAFVSDGARNLLFRVRLPTRPPSPRK